MNIQVLGASADQEPILANLLELYAHDFSAIADLTLDANGRFGYKDLPLYWRESNRHPFLIKADGELAGFALVQQGSKVSGDAQVWDLAEFFIVRRYRRQGVGTRAAHEVWQRCPGHWEVRVMQQNTAAQAFWSRAVASFVGHTVDAAVQANKGQTWNVFSFRSGS